MRNTFTSIVVSSVFIVFLLVVFWPRHARLSDNEVMEAVSLITKDRPDLESCRRKFLIPRVGGWNSVEYRLKDESSVYVLFKDLYYDKDLRSYAASKYFITDKMDLKQVKPSEILLGNYNWGESQTL